MTLAWILGFLFLPCQDGTLKPDSNPDHSLVKGHCSVDPIEAATFYHQAASPEAFAALAERNYLMGNYAVAIDYFRKSLDGIRKADPPNHDRQKIEATLNYWIGLCQFSMGNHVEAEKQLRKLVTDEVPICDSDSLCLESANQSELSPVVSTLARILEYKRRWTESSVLLENYLKKADKPSIRWLLDLRLQLGNLYFRLQKPKRAYLEFARILRFYPQSQEAFWLRDRYAHVEILRIYGPKVSGL